MNGIRSKIGRESTGRGEQLIGPLGANGSDAKGVLAGEERLTDRLRLGSMADLPLVSRVGASYQSN